MRKIMFFRRPRFSKNPYNAIMINWSKDSLSHYIRKDGSEVSFARDELFLGTWTAMVPSLSEKKSWSILKRNNSIAEYSNLEDAIYAVEDYLIIYKQLIPSRSTKIDMSNGTWGVPGAAS